MEDTFGMMVNIMKGISIKEINKEMVYRFIKIEINIMVNFIMEKEREKENFIFQMDICIKECS